MTVRHIQMRRGTSVSLALTARQADGTAIDLTGLTGTAIAWRISSENRKTLKFTKSIGSGITVTAATLGEFTAALVPADTSSLQPDWYEHECEVTSGSDIYTVLRGRLDLRRDIPA